MVCLVAVSCDCRVLVNTASTGLLINLRIEVNMGKREQCISMSDFYLWRNTTSREVKGNIVCGSTFACSFGVYNGNQVNSIIFFSPNIYDEKMRDSTIQLNLYWWNFFHIGILQLSRNKLPKFKFSQYTTGAIREWKKLFVFFSCE